MPLCTEVFEQLQSESCRIRGLSLRRWGAARSPEAAQCCQGRCHAHPTLLPQAGSGKCLSTGTYPCSCGGVRRGAHNLEQAAVRFNSSCVVTHRPCTMIEPPCFNSWQASMTYCLPLGVQSGPRWRQTVFSWAGSHVLPAREEPACCAQPLEAASGWGKFIFSFCVTIICANCFTQTSAWSKTQRGPCPDFCLLLGFPAVGATASPGKPLALAPRENWTSSKATLTSKQKQCRGGCMWKLLCVPLGESSVWRGQDSPSPLGCSFWRGGGRGSHVALCSSTVSYGHIFTKLHLFVPLLISFDYEIKWVWKTQMLLPTNLLLCLVTGSTLLSSCRKWTSYLRDSECW